MRVSILCIGNELLLDDGVGPAVARYIESRYRLPGNVRVVDCACMGMAVLSDLRDCDFALVLDAVDVPGEKPGKLFSFAPDDAAPTPAGATSLHDMRFADVLNSAQLLGVEAQGHCFGVQVQNMSPSEFIAGLTPRVAAAVPFLAGAAITYLRNVVGVDGIEDLLVSGDPYRAGRGFWGERDFSRTGRRCTGPQVPGEELARAPRVVLPPVYGDPTAAVAAEYLVASMRAIGSWAQIEGWADTRHGRGQETHPEATDGEGGAAADAAASPAIDAASSSLQADCTDRIAVLLSIAACGAPAIAERFGLEACEGDLSQSSTPPEVPEGHVVYRAYVGPDSTDYDLDALIGACANGRTV